MIPRAGSAFDPESAAAQKVLREIGIGESGFAHVGRAADRRRRAAPDRPRRLAADLGLRICAAACGEGRSLAFRMPPAVIDYVRAHRLYQAGPA